VTPSELIKFLEVEMGAAHHSRRPLFVRAIEAIDALAPPAGPQPAAKEERPVGTECIGCSCEGPIRLDGEPGYLCPHCYGPPLTVKRDKVMAIKPPKINEQFIAGSQWTDGTGLARVIAVVEGYVIWRFKGAMVNATHISEFRKQFTDCQEPVPTDPAP
jgi:Zn finger protein HypA/HybF involved in hydrogenase expression